jgi:hypothetical protein
LNRKREEFERFDAVIAISSPTSPAVMDRELLGFRESAHGRGGLTAAFGSLAR